MPPVYSKAEYFATLTRQVEIPPTTPEHYITGLYALNLAAPEGISGDRHDVFHWQDGTEQPRQVTLAGMGDIETTSIYGGLGINEGKDRLVAQGLDVPVGMQRVYIAKPLTRHLGLALPLPQSLGTRPQPNWCHHRLA